MFSDVKEKALEFATENSTTLLTAGGVVGVIGTGVVSFRAGFRSNERIRNKQKDVLNEITGDQYDADDTEPEEIQLTNRDMAIAVGPELIAPLVTGAATVTAIIVSHRMSANKIAALAAAYSIVDRNFDDYKAKVAEKLTGPKQQAVTDELAQEAVDRTPGHDQVIVIEGEVLCFDINAGRYFNSTVERIRQAANTTNAEVINRGFAPVSFFYDELDLEGAPWADAVGFGPDNMLELDISTTLKAGKPCVTIGFKKAPSTEYGDPKEY